MLRAFLTARKPILDQRPSALLPSDVRSMTDFFKQVGIGFNGSIKLADFGSGFVVDDGKRRGDLGVRGDVESPERMEQKDWGLPADIWSLGCTVIEVLTGRLFFRMSEQLKKKWSDELGLEMIRNRLGPDSTSDDAAKVALESFLAGEYERNDLSSHEIDAIGEMAARSIRWRPEVRSGVADILRIWEGE